MAIAPLLSSKSGAQQRVSCEGSDWRCGSSRQARLWVRSFVRAKSGSGALGRTHEVAVVREPSCSRGLVVVVADAVVREVFATVGSRNVGYGRLRSWKGGSSGWALELVV